MTAEFNKYGLENRLALAEGKSLLAISGGADSVVMAWLYHRSGFSFALAHCNFKLRNEASDGDEEFVKKLALELSVPFFSICFETQKIAETQKTGIQETARILRYEWLNLTAEKHGYDKIATAHHLDDNIETVLFNFANGTGIRGMKGIQPIRGNIIRPLLFSTKEEILAYAKKESLDFREDISNASDKYSRNHIRHHVVPALEEVAPNFRETANRTINNLNETAKLLSFLVEKVKEDVFKEEGNIVSIDVKQLLSYPASKTLLFELIRPYGFNRTHTKNMLETTDFQSGRSFLSSNHEAVFSNLKLKIKRKEITGGVNIHINKSDKSVNLPEGDLHLSIVDDIPSNFIRNTLVSLLDFDKIEWPIVLRRWKAGDVFQPLGMHGHRKKVQDLFTDKKLSKFEKEAAWILESGGKVAWVVGIRMDERFKVSRSTKSCLRIKFDPL